MNERAPLTYRDAGVDIDAGEELVERIKPSGARAPCAARCWAASAASARWSRSRSTATARPVLVSGTDGVGTKLRLAIDTGRHDTVGIDLVAMCANDVVVQGAEPLYFLDYFATGKLDVDVAERVDRRHRRGLRAGGLRPGRRRDRRDAGHVPRRGLRSRGLLRRHRREGRASSTARDTRAGDVVLGLPSSGPHSNGFSLIRRILQQSRRRSRAPRSTGSR